VILDAEFLVSIDRGEDSARSLLTAFHRSRIPLHTTEPVVAQVWRDGAVQARLARFLKTVTVHPLDDGKALGQLLAIAGTADVVDAHLVLVALRLKHDVLTGDTDDLSRITAPLGASAPGVRAWP
jgi:hypothetical protein